MTVIDLDPGNFTQEVEEEKTRLVLVNFCAPWCIPCDLIKIILQDIGEGLQEKFKFCQIDIEEYPTLADRFEIRGVPYLLIFKEGKVLHKLVGLTTKAQLLAIIEETSTRIN